MPGRSISRRQFIETSIVGAVTAVGVPGLDAQTGASSAGPGQEGPGSRLRSRLNEDWKFKRQGSPGQGAEPEFVGAEQPTYNDSSWAQVCLPHTWDATPDNPFVSPGHFRGVGWYRKRLEVPQSWHNHRVLIQFNAVFQVANAWVNGKPVGQHVGGYTSFAFDVTDALNFGKTNLLAIKVDDVLSPFIAPAEERNVANYGGIYRTVWLEVMDPCHVRYHGTWVTLEGDEQEPVVRVRTWLSNQGTSSRTVRLESNVVDATGTSKAKIEAHAEIGPGEVKSFDQKTATIQGPQLWSPDSPYLYHLVSTVWEGDRALDRYETRFGIRFMRHDAANGFTLNGKPINLHGVDRRQDYGFLGDAVPEVVGARDIRLMKEMGVNFFRTSHYPQDVAVLDACDELGILVWEEVPNLAVHIYPPPQDGYMPVYTTRFPWPLMENLKLQLREMVERDRSRPSVIIWGFADDLSEYQFPEDFAYLSDYTHTLDHTRWTAGRCPHVTDIMDATTYRDLWSAHEENPEKKYIWNEWGAIPCERGREGPSLVVRNEIHAVSDSVMALIQEGYLMQWNAMPWLGTAKWVMFDCGEPNGVVSRPLWTRPDNKLTLRWPFNDYLGVSDMWRLPKSAYFLFQSEWTEKPMIHIVGHWTWRHQEVKPGEIDIYGNCDPFGTEPPCENITTLERQIRVYSNCDTVELLLNGRSLGVRQPASTEQVWGDFRRVAEKYPELRNDQFAQKLYPGAHLTHPPFIWDNITYEPGTLVAVGHKAGQTFRHELRTAGNPAKISLKPEKQTISADGNDVSFIEADVVDRNGTTVPWARPWISFTVQGPGRLLGGTTTVDAISGRAVINVQSTGQPGEIVVEASALGVESGSARIQAVRT
ncbi:MAG: glycoside hydrolase family 2 protein [Terriglobia bacterium]